MKTKIMWLSFIGVVIILAIPESYYHSWAGYSALVLMINAVIMEYLAQNDKGRSDIKKIKNELDFLEKEMNGIEKMNNKVEAIVHLFKVISPIQDKGGFSQTITKLKKKNYGQLTPVISALDILQSHFKNAGRNIYGFNRTKVGEEVCPEKVFLGNIFEILTKPASYWLENQKELEKTFRPDVSKDKKNPVSTWYLINNYQAEEFVKSHTDGILKQISIIKKSA